MKKRYIGIAGLGLVLALGTQQVHAQQGFGTTEPHKSAAVDIQSSKRGLLIPRVDLVSTVNGTTPIDKPKQSLMVYNQATTTNGANDVTPGYYYWDTDRWVRFAQQGDFSEITLAGDVTGKVGETKVVALQGTAISNVAPTANQVLVFVPGEGTNPGKWVPTSLPTQPWNVQGGNTKATENTQNIYQQGKVGIGFTDASVATKTLDVRGDFKTEGKLGDTNQYSGLVTNESIANTSLGILYAAKAPFTSYEELIVQDESTSVMTTPGGTNIISNGVEHQASATVNASTSAYSVQMIGQRRATTAGGQASSMFWMNSSQTLLKQTNNSGISEVAIDAGKGVTFSFNDGTKDLGSYTFPRTNGNANQVLTSTGQPPAGSTAPLVWKSVTDLITPGTEGQVLTTTKEGDNAPKVEWKTPAVHENIYTHDGTLMGASDGTRTVDFGPLINMTFKKGSQSHQFTYDDNHTGINMFGMTKSSINLIATDEEIEGDESKLELFHNSLKSEINSNSNEGLWITAGLNQKIALGKRYFHAGESIPRYDKYLEINHNGAVRVNKINEEEFKGSASDKVVVADATGVLKTTTAAMPKVFYMPPVMFNTAAIGTGKTRNLYNEYVAMYGGTGTVVDMPNRSPLKKNDDAENTTIPVFGVKELDFYVSYYDPEVFANVNVDNNGVLTYDVKKKAKYGSFMTIVFVVRDNARQ